MDRPLYIAPKPDETVVAKLRAKGEGGGSSAAAAQVEITSFGHLKGKFIFDGDAPQLAPISVTKETDICGGNVPDESLVVDPASKGLANVVIYATKVPAVYAGPDAQVSTFDFDQDKCIFLSHVLIGKVGEKINLKNSDRTAHNINTSPPGNPSLNVLIPPKGGATYSFVRPMNEPTAVVCNVHPHMKAYLMARKDPYFAVTAKDGSFEIRNLPAGVPLEFQVWHEKSKGKGGPLEASSQWKRGRFKVTIPADDTLELETVTVNAGNFGM